MMIVRSDCVSESIRCKMYKLCVFMREGRKDRKWGGRPETATHAAMTAGPAVPGTAV